MLSHLTLLSCSFQAYSPVQVSLASKASSGHVLTPSTSISGHSNTPVGPGSVSVYHLSLRTGICWVLFSCCHHTFYKKIVIAARPCSLCFLWAWFTSTRLIGVNGDTFSTCSPILERVWTQSVAVRLLRWWSRAAGPSASGNSGSNRTGCSRWARHPLAATALSGEVSWRVRCRTRNLFYLPRIKQKSIHPYFDLNAGLASFLVVFFFKEMLILRHCSQG